MNKEIDIFSGKELASFGGRSLSDNLDAACRVVESMSTDFRIHNHSNTQFAWHRFVLNHKGGARNIRQITAEIDRKNRALIEAKHKYARQKIEVDIARSKINDLQAGKFERRLLEADIARLTDEMALGLPPIEGAIKDILILKRAYDELMVKYADYTEADFEREEADYWIRRLLSQALRDLREFDRITKGEQEALEQIGFNVSHVKRMLITYLKNENETRDPTGKMLADFLDNCVEKYRDQVTDFVGYGGFKGEVMDGATYSSTASLKETA